MGLAVVVRRCLGEGSAFAFDCIRVSSSLQGLQHSTKSGNWLVFDLSTPDGLPGVAGRDRRRVTGEQAPCGAGRTPNRDSCYFAIGIGVAGGENENSSAGGVLAHNNPNASVLGNGKGIDHLEESGIFPALEAAAVTCGIPV